MSSVLTGDETKNRKKRKLELETEQGQLRSEVHKIERKLSVVDNELNLMKAEDECNNILIDMQKAFVEVSEAGVTPSVLAQLICDYQQSLVFHVFLKSSVHAKYLLSLPVEKSIGVRVIENSLDWTYGFAEGDEENPTTDFPFMCDNDDGKCPVETCPRRRMTPPFGLSYRDVSRKTNFLVSNVADTVNIHISDWEKECNKDEWIYSRMKIDSDADFYHVHYVIPGSCLLILCYSDFTKQLQSVVADDFLS